MVINQHSEYTSVDAAMQSTKLKIFACPNSVHKAMYLGIISSRDLRSSLTMKICASEVTE
jgi:hypothetical protein